MAARDTFSSRNRDGWIRFGQSVLRPEMPRFGAVHAAAREVVSWHMPRGRSRMSATALTDVLTDPSVVADAWDVLCTRFDLIDLLSSPRRAFLPFVPFAQVEYTWTRGPRAEDTPRNLSETPLNVETAVLLLSSDVSHMLAAEELALEASRRMERWGVKGPTRVAWVMLEMNWPWPSPSMMSIFAWPSHASMQAVTQNNHEEIARAIQRESPDQLGELGRSARRLARAAALGHVSFYARGWNDWGDAAAAHRSIPPNTRYPFLYPEKMGGVPFKDLPDPLDPLLRVWGLGYVPIDIRGDVMVLGVGANFESPVTAPTWGALKKAQTRRFGRGLSSTEDLRYVPSGFESGRR